MSVHPGLRLIALGLLSARAGHIDNDVLLVAGTGAPSGGQLASGQVMASGQTALYVRQDATGLDNALHFTADGGTTWSAAELRPATIADPGNAGAIPVTASGVCPLTSAGAGETRTMAIPSYLGQRMTLVHDTDGGDIAITVAAAINQAGATVITMGEVGDLVDLVAVTIGGALRWRVVVNDGSVLS